MIDPRGDLVRVTKGTRPHACMHAFWCVYFGSMGYGLSDLGIQSDCFDSLFVKDIFTSFHHHCLPQQCVCVCVCVKLASIKVRCLDKTMKGFCHYKNLRFLELTICMDVDDHMK